MAASGYCLAFVRECFDVGSYYASAIDAWHGAPDQHPGDRNPPPAVPLFFLSPSPYDHVVFGGDPGEIITTFNDDVRRYTGPDVIAQVERDFDGSYLGWTESINGVRVHVPGGDEDMDADQDQRLRNVEAALGRMEPLTTDTQARVRGSDPNADMLQLTSYALGRIEPLATETQVRVRGSDPNADMLQLIKYKTDTIPAPGARGATWTPSSVVAAIAFGALALMVVAVFLIAAATGTVPADLERATVYLAFVLAGGLLARMLGGRAP
jgi:hypothetical protein